MNSKTLQILKNWQHDCTTGQLYTCHYVTNHSQNTSSNVYSVSREEKRQPAPSSRDVILSEGVKILLYKCACKGELRGMRTGQKHWWQAPSLPCLVLALCYNHHVYCCYHLISTDNPGVLICCVNTLFESAYM